MPAPISTNPKDRIGRLKPPIHLIPPVANVLESQVLDLGARKYGPFNWRAEKVAASVYVSAALRHLLGWFDGEDNDSESGVTHLASVRACMGILMDAQCQGSMVDDRPRKGTAGEWIKRLTKVKPKAKRKGKK